MECYNCGAAINSGDVCRNCGADIKLYKKILLASNEYYNDGLKKAGVRDLSGAIESLRMSLRFNKLNIDARNLLGLVYFEMGEVVEALTEWVISKNYKPKENIASRYLNEIQHNPSRLESINQTIKKYNQALMYCRQDNRDMAIIQLKKVLSMNPKLVSGHQLLALLYIQEHKYDLAKKSLRNAGKIDVNNTMTLRYLREVNIAIREGNSGKKQKNHEDLISYQSGNETIIQPRYLKDTSAMGTIVNMLIGIIIGASITGFLVIPGMRRSMLDEAKAQVLEANNTIASKNQTISSLETQIEEMTGEITAAKDSEQDYENHINSYAQLLSAYAAYTKEDTAAAGEALGNVNEEYLVEEAKQIYDTINTEVNADYVKKLYNAGTKAYSAQKYEEAIDNLQKVLEMDESYEEGFALYYLAQSYRRNGDLATAKIYYQKFVDLYPNTERAVTAQNYLNIEE